MPWQYFLMGTGLILLIILVIGLWFPSGANKDKDWYD